MRRVILIGLLVLAPYITARAQYYYNWSIGGNLGLGIASYKGEDAIGWGLTVGFNKAIGNTKWRWGLDGGGLVLGGEGKSVKKNEDAFIHPTFVYLGGVVDYCFLSKGIIDIYARGGIAPAYQNNIYYYHVEPRFAALGMAGVGVDIGVMRISLTNYISQSGAFMLLWTIGCHFGKIAAPK